MIEVRSFYSFQPLTNNEQRAERLTNICESGGLLGTMLLADEGINSTLAGSPAALDALFAELANDPEIGELDYRRSEADFDAPPFSKLKVRQQGSVLTFPEAAADEQPEHVEPEAWDALLAREDVQLVDTRNGYETCIGKFKGARVLPIENFHELPDALRFADDLNPNAPVALYCTGGIRCEKASMWMREQGFNEVYQLAGGILNYLEQTSSDASNWQGDCFVFDQRIAIGHNLAPVPYTLCQGCQRPVRAGGQCEQCETGAMTAPSRASG